jgi:tRNA (cytidine/uridine-2'-O-)-methyltransferase
MHLALYEPDIPQNTGTILRLCACLGMSAHIIEPAGFPVTDRAFRRAGMDYLDVVDLTRHASFDAFETWRGEGGGRLVLLTTTATQSYLDFAYRDSDVLLLGRESAGAGACGRRRAPVHPDPPGVALAQRGDGGGDGGRRGIAAGGITAR